ncbi:hypothetical protein [Citricoccus sp. I39-566]|uniref:hypothetical protein n=1 Tax=Citricoccus sp. I39-566 TaxID=3073268 RepID=UPI00286B3BDD|nr:hypothetical protein [Citricoccus sp. I39-566]WMY78705.1 hypothetical protein RE421_02215 [Citricoccus sp. I39-566]
MLALASAVVYGLVDDADGLWAMVAGRAAVALASLYPVIPVLLGVFVLRERVTSRRAVGLVSAGIAAVLLSLG